MSLSNNAIATTLVQLDRATGALNSEVARALSLPPPSPAEDGYTSFPTFVGDDDVLAGIRRQLDAADAALVELCRLVADDDQQHRQQKQQHQKRQQQTTLQLVRLLLAPDLSFADAVGAVRSALAVVRTAVDGDNGIHNGTAAVDESSGLDTLRLTFTPVPQIAGARARSGPGVFTALSEWWSRRVKQEAELGTAK